MKIVQIFINDIKVIADWIENNKYDCNGVLSLLNGEIENQRVSDGYNKIIIRKVSGSILAAIVDCKDNEIKAISFNGSIDINPKELFMMFENYREGYSIQDDLYFYFFNEDKQKGNYEISFFEPSHKQVNIYESEENISNLTLTWR
jgi:ABC-type xylose transport system substrate-binding protein